MGGHGHAGGREEGQHREQKVPHHVGVGPPLPQKQGLQIVGERECNDGEVGGDGEHGEEGEEDVDQELGPGVTLFRL